MHKKEQEIMSYYRQIKKELVCSEKSKRIILKNIKTATESFLADTPDADIAAVMLRIGTPKQIAESYIEEINITDIQKQMKIRRQVLVLIASAVAAALLIWCVAVVIASVREWVIPNGYYEVIVNEGPSSTINEGE